MSTEKKNNRRGFLKSVLVAGGAIATTSPLLVNADSSKKEKVKMLTADGKLVEVDKSVLERNAGLKKASGKEVFNWMNKEHKR